MTREAGWRYGIIIIYGFFWTAKNIQTNNLISENILSFHQFNRPPVSSWTVNCFDVYDIIHNCIYTISELKSFLFSLIYSCFNINCLIGQFSGTLFVSLTLTAHLEQKRSKLNKLKFSFFILCTAELKYKILWYPFTSPAKAIFGRSILIANYCKIEIVKIDYQMVNDRFSTTEKILQKTKHTLDDIQSTNPIFY